MTVLVSESGLDRRTVWLPNDDQVHLSLRTHLPSNLSSLAQRVLLTTQQWLSYCTQQKENSFLCIWFSVLSWICASDDGGGGDRADGPLTALSGSAVSCGFCSQTLAWYFIVKYIQDRFEQRIINNFMTFFFLPCSSGYKRVSLFYSY